MLSNCISNAASIARQSTSGARVIGMSDFQGETDGTCHREDEGDVLMTVLLDLKLSLDRFVEVQEMQSACLTRVLRLLEASSCAHNSKSDVVENLVDVRHDISCNNFMKHRKHRKKRYTSAPIKNKNCGGMGTITNILTVLIYVVFVVYQPLFGMGDDSSGEFNRINLENITLTNIGTANGTEMKSENSSSIILSHGSTDVWNTSDGFSFMHSSQGEGDFVLSISIDSLDSLGLIRAGLMIRETLEPSSRQVFLNFGSSKKIGLLTRDITDNSNKEVIKSYNFERGELLLRKFGSTLSGFARAASKEDWAFISSQEIGFNSFYVGVAVSTQPLLGRCGGGDINDGVCKVESGKCCSQFGFCGNSDNHCNKQIGNPLPVDDTSTLQFSNLIADISIIEPIGIPRRVLDISWYGNPISSTINKFDVTLASIQSALGIFSEMGQGSWSIASSSRDISGTDDAFSYLHSSQAEGDFIISFSIDSFVTLSNERTPKAGLMIRETLAKGSRHVFLYVDGSGQIGFLMRDATNGKTEQKGNSIFASPDFVSLYHEDFQRGEFRLRKQGTEVTGYVRAATHKDWARIDSVKINFNSFFVGIAVASQTLNIANLEFSNLDTLLWMSTPAANIMNTLTSFYEATGGDAWANNEGWQETETYCDWHGITCDDDGNVTSIFLRENNLRGTIWPSNTSHYFGLGLDLLHHLSFIDLSHNNLSGEVDVLLTPKTTWYVDFSHNNFSSVSKLDTSKLSFKTLEFLRLNHNSIEQDVNELINDNTPPNLKEIRLSNNNIKGTLPSQMPFLKYLEVLTIDNNELSGGIPQLLDFSLPLLTNLSMSNQLHLTGPIPVGLSRMKQMKSVDVSKNMLSGSIPPVIGKMNLDSLDLSNNNLLGLIPSELADMQDCLISLSGNAGLSTPSPLSLCLSRNYDLVNNTESCPPERLSLKNIYDRAKGTEWTENRFWLDEHTQHCLWHGVTCDDTNTTVYNLTLRSNGLSGRLSRSIADLRSLNILDLSDNELKGHLPLQIGYMSNLTYLRLSYNAFVGTIPSLKNLNNLSLFHLHGNRLQGSVPYVDKQAMSGDSSFITDCGVPTDFDEPLECEDCTVCCNSDGDCHFNKVTAVEEAGFTSYKNFSWVFFLSMLLFFCLVATLSYLRERRRHLPIERQLESSRRLWVINRGNMLATIGTDSVYCFVLSKSWRAWTILTIVVVLQLWMLFEFVGAAQLDFTDDKSEFIYSWKCPRNSEECWDESDTTWTGWFIFALMMVSHLMSDFLNGLKLLVMCGKQRLSHYRRMRLFLGGVCLCLVSSFTAFASTVYNMAIARSNPDIIVNSIIILFITDIDEKFCKLITVISPKWVQMLTGHNVNGIGPDIEAGRKSDNGALEDEVENLRKEVERLRQLVVNETSRMNESQPQDMDGLVSPSKRYEKQQSMGSDSETGSRRGTYESGGSEDYDLYKSAIDHDK